MSGKLHRNFNIETRFALFEKVDGYVDRSKPKEILYEELKAKHNLERIYRFDLGENTSGFSPKTEAFTDNFVQTDKYKKQLNEYPETSDYNLCKDIAKKFGLQPQHIILGTGSEYFIDLISRALITEGRFFISPSPSFFLFDDYASRCGGKLCSLILDSKDNFAWTEKTTEKYFKAISLMMPKIKLVWIANPNNPTGQVMDLKTIETIVKYANDHNVFVVVDEAYGEFTDTDKKIVSATSLLDQFENLIVLRTFSKAYGLAGIRLGYLMSKSEMVIRGIMAHRNVYPFTQHSLQLAHSALQDDEFLKQTRKLTTQRMKSIGKKINRLSSFLMLPSSTNIFMLKNKLITAKELNEAFESKGIMASPVFIEDKLEFLRITVRNEADNEYFCKACAEIDGQINTKVLNTNNKKPNPPLKKEEELLNFPEIMRILEEEECLS